MIDKSIQSANFIYCHPQHVTMFIEQILFEDDLLYLIKRDISKYYLQIGLQDLHTLLNDPSGRPYFLIHDLRSFIVKAQILI